MTPLARTAGHALALTALAIAFAAAVRAPAAVRSPPGGLLPWLFAGLVAVAVVGVFVYVLWTAQRPAEEPPATPAGPPGAAVRR